MRKNFRLNEEETRDIEVIEFLGKARNEADLIKNALLFYKKAIEKKVIFDTNICTEEMWDNIFETSVPLGLIKEDREDVKRKLLKQKAKENKRIIKEEIKEVKKEENPPIINPPKRNQDKIFISLDDLIEDTRDM